MAENSEMSFLGFSRTEWEEAIRRIAPPSLSDASVTSLHAILDAPRGAAPTTGLQLSPALLQALATTAPDGMARVEQLLARLPLELRQHVASRPILPNDPQV